MSYRQPGEGQHSRSSADGYWASIPSSVETRTAEWSDVTDPVERRRIQNKLAQQRFRAKVKEQTEEADRAAENLRQAASSYIPPEATQLYDHHTLSGLPWGGISFKHVVATGQSKERSSQQSSQDNSVYTIRAGGSSRLGLCLTDRFARGHAAWRPFGTFTQRLSERYEE